MFAGRLLMRAVAGARGGSAGLLASAVPSLLGQSPIAQRSVFGSSFARTMASKPVAPFEYQPLLELGAEDIPWRKLETGSEQLVSTINVGGSSIDCVSCRESWH